MLTASERAQEELAAFQGLQTLGIDADAPAALKASPSGSGSENGGSPPYKSFTLMPDFSALCKQGRCPVGECLPCFGTSF